MTQPAVLETPRPPTVYFIDDSATMREVMKIAFRRENIGVVACHDAASALLEIEQAQPDLVISDVVMPGKDGFEVCQFIKQHAQLHKTPVVLLSGVVNREVADKAVSVKADELIRKPFQPQDLIARVKQLLAPRHPVPVPPPAASAADTRPRGELLSGIFGGAPAIPRPAVFSSAAAPMPQRTPAPAPPARPGTSDVTKLRLEILRLENLVKKLQSELVAERDYARALEEHVKTLHDAN